ncbi:type III-B CRISPR module RAMP protein Cmr1 [Kutzneria sp. 744]|uniref:type III-B CRISPR module RAMP protein Cmr1 n=1 Tax=Kutzneria sp. (strain 744) TaxID=345341 RepID=UPI0003EED1BB|nr:type III-B CRISPR module RAMP protein Cmr1 [Kutzneria sp. 744]EWM19880.1 CRISPR-associated protein [Kutzneria sp. 744]
MTSRWVTFHLRTMTPLFSGDDPKSETGDSPIRVPSIRGVLRYWFRAVAAGHGITAAEDLWTAEEAVFGSTTTPSPIALRVSGCPEATGRNTTPEWARSNHVKYLLGQGLYVRDKDPRLSGLTRPYVDVGKPVNLDVRLSADDIANRRFLMAMWAWLTYGGLGARTRRGFGRLVCDGVDGPLPSSWIDRMFTPPRTTAAWQSLLDQVYPRELQNPQHIGLPQMPADRPADAPLATFPTLHLDSWRGRILGGSQRGWKDAMAFAGEKWRDYRTIEDSSQTDEWQPTIRHADGRFPLAALGLPVGYFLAARHNDGVEYKAVVEPRSGVAPLRRASPMWLLPVKTDRGWAVVSHCFWAELLPDGVTLRLDVQSGGPSKDLTLPDRETMEAAWDGWFDGYPRLPDNYFRQG